MSLKRIKKIGTLLTDILKAVFIRRVSVFSGMPVKKSLVAKSAIVKYFARFFSKRLTVKQVMSTCTNIDDFEPFNQRKTIFIFLHQYFMNYIMVWLCEKGLYLNTLKANGRKKFNAPFLKELHDSTGRFKSHKYIPILTMKNLMDKLNDGENIMTAADNKSLGGTFCEVEFGKSTMKTPLGIYSLSLATGAEVVPVFVSLKRLFPYPRLELRMGKGFTIEKSVEGEIEKVASAFQWFYENIEDDLVLWSRLDDERYFPSKFSKEKCDS